ncbi:polyprenyl synthetase family protein [Jeotgalibaca porci]|uniref:polyprenyl synthetase family protein n=1 Tax=Jeotgalibaca porci TaxID=1868793 RepID=UPI0035A16E5F
MKVHPMWDAYPALRYELEATISLIDQQVTIKNEEVQHKIKEMLFSGGKLLRPAYSLLFSELSKERNPERARAVAAALEVLHMATLVHDDVIDESAKRRGQETLNSAYGNRIAVYTGDYLFTLCFRLLQDHADSARELDLDTKGMEKILLGELNQMDRKYDSNMRMRDYLNQIQGKTAQLFALSCYSGAYNTPYARQAYQIGSNIGMAFQITDDILDFASDDSKTGKPVLQDVKNGIYTAPVLYAKKKRGSDLLPLLEKGEAITNDELNAVYEIVVASGGLAEAQALAGKYTRKALKQIEKLPESVTQKTLSLITEQMLNREH